MQTDELFPVLLNALLPIAILIVASSILCLCIQFCPIEDPHDLDHEHDEEGMPLQRGYAPLTLPNPGFHVDFYRSLSTAPVQQWTCHKDLVGAFPEDPCVICLEDYEHGQSVMMLPCAHLFHQDCITLWFFAKYMNEQHWFCPTCRQRVPHTVML